MITYRNVRKVLFLFFLIGSGIAFASLLFEGPWQKWVMLGGFVIFFIGFWVFFHHWRCPYCDWMLPWRETHIDYCPHCGKKIDWR